LRTAAGIGKKFGALGLLNTDWGDGGHPQPLAVSWPMYAAGAALAWNSADLDEDVLERVLNRDIYEDASGVTGRVAMRLGRAHQKLGVAAVNETPLGTVIAAPPPEERELFCRNGLQWFARITAGNILATEREIRQQREALRRGRRRSDSAIVLAVELDLAARMAEQSCRFILWQQAVAAGKVEEARRMAEEGIAQLKELRCDFNDYWPVRNQATSRHCTPFLQWRISDYRAFMSQASRKPSPRKLRASRVVTKTPPGKAISHQ
jgi:hypothetical protein